MYPAFANDALIPEVWAQEALLQLENNLVITNLIHRDYSSEIARFGDVVNCHRPNSRTANRKNMTTSLDPSATTTTNVPVTLNQHLYDTFIIYDGEESKSMKSLVATHLTPAIKGIAQTLDQIVATSTYRHLSNSVGRLGQGISESTIIAARKAMNNLGVPMSDRYFVVTADMEADLLDIELLTSAEKVGDRGEALREALLGRKFGFNIAMDQNCPSIAAQTTVEGAINKDGGYAAGTSTFTVDSFSAAINNGSWIKIAGDDTPLMVTGTTGGSTPTEIVTSQSTQRAVDNNAVVYVYPTGAINEDDDYSAAEAEALTVDGLSAAPSSGHLVSINANTTYLYGLLNTPTTTSILPDRPLGAAISDDDVVGLGPSGEYGFAFHPECQALVTRPLAPPMADTGVRGFVAEYNGLSIRVVISYSPKEQGHIVTIDLLAGMATLNEDLGVTVLG
jgi:hypothetical protein